MRRTMLVQADLDRGVQIDPVLAKVTEALPALNLDPSVAIRFKGGAQTQQETASFLIKAFLIALGLIALFLCYGLAIYMIFMGRLHRVAFLRKVRVASGDDRPGFGKRFSDRTDKGREK
jgi:hypothetical protein